MTPPETRPPDRWARVLLVGVGIVLVLAGLGFGFYAVFTWMAVKGGWGSVSGEEFLLWLPAVESALGLAAGAFLIWKGARR